ncbi:hypothetical protein BH10BAC4_BH10BAC4_21690 [soil metagenome]
MIELRLLKIVLGYLILALVLNALIPIAANHGRLDFSNESLKPYLKLTFVILIELMFVVVLILRCPAKQDFLYFFSIPAFLLISATLAMSLREWLPEYWTIFSTSVFVVELLGVLLSIYLSIMFLLRKEISN